MTHPTTKPLGRSSDSVVFRPSTEVFISRNMPLKNIKIVALSNQDNPNRVVQQLEQLLVGQGVGCQVELIGQIKLSEINAMKLRKIQEILVSKRNEIVVFFPGTTELYLKEPDLNIVFSGYRTWCDQRFKVIPAVDCPNGMPPDDQRLRWNKKPELSVGFMGNGYNNSTAAKIGTKFPKKLKRWFIEGQHINHINMMNQCFIVWRSCIFVSCLVRREAISTLKSSHLNRQIVERQAAYTGAEKEYARFYQDHLLNHTYILCPRGMENWSFRFYEALYYGRVPVLIDSDMMLPPGIDWNKLCVRVPYEKLELLDDFIRNDYQTKTETDFIERQNKAITTMQEIRQFQWLQGIVNHLVEMCSS